MTRNQCLLDELSEKFFQLEEEFNVFEIKPYGVPIWERIRFNLYADIRKNLINQNYKVNKSDHKLDGYLKGINLWLKNLFFKNPYFSGKHDFLFYGHPRRKLGADNKWWDLYCDPITATKEIDYLHVERPYLMDHETPAKTENLRYLDFIWFSGAIRRNLGLSDVTVTGEDKERLKKVSRAVYDRFDVDVDLVHRTEKKLTRRDSTVDLYKWFLRRVDPSVVVVVVSYGKHSFIEACTDLGIPTVELQHGLIHSTHMGYSFPEYRTKETFPDYILTWGEFWSNCTEYAIPDQNVIVTGYPYIEQRKKQYADIASKDQIVFISQKIVGEKLSRFAVEVNGHPDIDHSIVYKLHPREYNDWQDEYPWLVGTEIDVVDSSEPPLYELSAESSAQVGVSSTAMFEGLYFDLETYVYESFGSSVMRSLVDEGAAEMISSVDELASLLGTMEMKFNRHYYFESNATENVYDTLHRIASEA